MSYVAPAVKDKFETLSIDLKNVILERNVQINTIHDLINVLDDIVKEAEEDGKQWPVGNIERFYAAGCTDWIEKAVGDSNSLFDS